MSFPRGTFPSMPVSSVGDGEEEEARTRARQLIASHHAVLQERDALREALAAREAEVGALKDKLHAAEVAARPLRNSVQALDSEVQVLREGRAADKRKIRELGVLLAECSSRSH
eukprot:Hpha_TRINITY_DN25283_c0_g1::TRINITY_DN25283_c0_g1_i1::g.110810::m.110810